MSKYTEKDYTFVICAYKQSVYLEECIKSLMNQTIKGNIMLATSTPNEHIEKLVKKYDIEYHINTGEQGIAQDWNFAYSCAKTSIITIVHQDDIYEPKFGETTLININRQESPLIAFTDYGEIRNADYITDNRLLNIKRLMLFSLRSTVIQKSRFVRRRILSFGSPICCPSVTYVKDNLPLQIFTPQYRSDVDWQAWERLSKLKGAFVFCNEVLMYHRIHAESATTEIIADNDRTKEDYEMFCRFWPKWIARLIEHFYRKGEISNEI